MIKSHQNFMSIFPGINYKASGKDPKRTKCSFDVHAIQQKKR